jgi:hypothetical protein
LADEETDEERESVRRGQDKGLMQRLSCAFWGILLLSGCGRSDAPLALVSGEVLFQGRPLAGGTIVFTPDPQRGGRGPQSWAQIKPDGRFVLAAGERKGAVPGWHRITIAPGKDDRRRFPPRYLDPELSGQSFEVKAELANFCTLHLQ